MGSVQKFLEEYALQAKDPRTFNDYYDQKYKTTKIPYYLWEAELMFYAAKYFRKDPAETIVNEEKLNIALEKYKLENDSQQKEVLKPSFRKKVLDTNTVTKTKKPTIRTIKDEIKISLAKSVDKNISTNTNSLNVDIELELFENY